jgi:hypothetical protein
MTFTPPAVARDARPVPGHDGYCASPDGRLFTQWRGGSHRKRTGIWRRLYGATHVKSGAIHASINNTRTYLGRIILLTFVGPAPPGTECCHGDGDPSNNCIDNLRWDTRQGNVNDAKRHGTTPRGERSGRSLLTDTKVVEIRQLASEGWTQLLLAARFKVSRPAISCVLSGKTWTHVPMGPPPIRRTYKLTTDQREDIVRLRLAGASYQDISERFHVDKSYVWQLTRNAQLSLQQ